MTKYNIEGGIDFFTELYKSLDIDENEQKTDEDNNLCLITNHPLTTNFFQMSCGHKFNYIPLYYDIKNHKQKFNGFESSHCRLNQDEIRCPYCRNKQNGVLPYYEDLGLEKLHGINYIDPNFKSINSSAIYYKTCQFITSNPNFDPNGGDIVETHATNSGNCKFLTCSVLGSQINYYHGMFDGTNYGDENYYCWSHKKQIIKKHKKDIIYQAKAELKEAKKKEKEEMKNEKKRLLKEEKEKLKKSKIVEQNIVLGVSIISVGNNEEPSEEINGCTEILKSGPNKGNKCGSKIFCNNMCKRHSKAAYDL